MRRSLLSALFLAGCASQEVAPSRPVAETAADAARRSGQYARCVSETAVTNPSAPIWSAVSLGVSQKCPPNMEAVDTATWNSAVSRAEAFRGLMPGQGRVMIEQAAVKAASPKPGSPEEVARQNQLARVRADADERVVRDQQAEAICEYRGRQTDANLPYRGLLHLDGIIAGANAKNACMEMYRRTGMMPTP